MRFLKNNVIFRLYNSYVVDSPQPANISYVWNFGSLLAVCLILQILTGCFLAMHYIANTDLAFDSVEHINFLHLFLDMLIKSNYVPESPFF
jgi:quinol-cytochrome oxidoreductase complex cytochrome b subunit